MSLSFREIAAIELMTHPAYYQCQIEGPPTPIMRTPEDAARDAQDLAEAFCAKHNHDYPDTSDTPICRRCGCEHGADR